MSDFLLSLKDVSLAFGGPQILDRVSLSVHKGLRAALTGRNGEGKSTLMKVIAGTLEPDTGEIVRAPGLKVVYVGQGVEDLRRETEDIRGRETLDIRPVSGLKSNVLSSLSSQVSSPSVSLSGGQIRRKALEDATGISGKLILTWTNHADLFRVKGVGPQFAELLEAAGVDTVKELKTRNAANLAAKMLEVNEAKHLVRRVPVEIEIQRMIDQAKDLPAVMTY